MLSALAWVICPSSGGDEDVAGGGPEVGGAGGFAAGKAGDAAGLRDVGEQGGDVQPFFVAHAAAVVLRGDDERARVGKESGCDAADVAHALHGHAGAGDAEVQALGRFDADGEHAPAGGFAPAQRAAQADGLAGDDAGGGFAQVGGVGVHHPGHDFFVGIDVRGGDVLGGADDDADFAGVAAGQALEFALGEFARIDANTAFGAAIGHADGGVFDGHPG